MTEAFRVSAIAIPGLSAPASTHQHDQGVSLAQDSRFKDKSKKYLKSLKFDAHIDRKVISVLVALV